jgi:hypothetical protein
VSVPQRTAEQRADALTAALAARRERSRLKAALKARDLTVLDVLEGAPRNPLWGGLKVLWLLECVPGVGSVRAERILATVQIAPSRRVQGLGERQRAALIVALGGGE